MSGIFKLGWLPIQCNRSFNLSKVVLCKAFYNKDWPSYLKLQLLEPVHELRYSNELNLVVPICPGTLKDIFGTCNDRSLYFQLIKITCV